MNTAAPLPTRVNRACDRCRRNKSRCDSYRPCSLCLRASAVCETTGSNPGSNNASSGNSTRHSIPAYSRTVTARPSAPVRSPQDTPTQRKRRRTDTSGSAGGNETLGATSSRPDDLRSDQRASQSPHDSERFHGSGGDSAIDLAQRVRGLL
jgi:hypothetical protein